MGVIYSTDRPNNSIYIVWDGEINIETWLDQVNKLSAEPDWPAISRVVTDTRTASTSVSLDDIEKAAALFGARPEALRNKKLAVLATGIFGRARAFSTLLERFGVSTIVFNDLDTACIFLGLDPADAGQRLDELRLQLRGGSGPSHGPMRGD